MIDKTNTDCDQLIEQALEKKWANKSIDFLFDRYSAWANNKPLHFTIEYNELNVAEKLLHTKSLEEKEDYRVRLYNFIATSLHINHRVELKRLTEQRDMFEDMFCMKSMQRK